MTVTQIYIVAVLIGLALFLGGGGYMLVLNSGKPMQKGALKVQEKCQTYKEENEKEKYKQCQLALDAVVLGLIQEGLLDIQKCIKNPKESFTAFCYVKVWYRDHKIQTAVPGILEMIRMKETGQQLSPADNKDGNQNLKAQGKSV